jgi:hypothetical protein
MRWDLPFETPIAAEGRALATLRDAAEYLSERLGSVRSAAVEGAAEDLMAAAESGKAAAVAAAREQTVRALHARYLIPADRPKPVAQRWGKRKRA